MYLFLDFARLRHDAVVALQQKPFDPILGSHLAQRTGEVEEEIRTEAELDEEDDVVSEELAEIYVAQGLRAEGADIYRKLSLRNPEKKDDKTAIFENWCDFLNYFDASVSVQLSFGHGEGAVLHRPPRHR